MRLPSPGVGVAVVAAAATVGMVVVAPSTSLPWALCVAAAVVVGGLLTAKAPGNRVGWAVLVFGITTASGALLVGLSTQVSSTAAAGWLDAAGNAVTTAGVMALPWALIRFPDGTLLSTRWRVVEWLVIVAAGLGAAAALLNGGWGGDTAQAVVASPLRSPTEPVGDVLSAVFYPAMTAAMISAGLSLILRYRRSRGDARLQIKWLAYAGSFLILTFVVVISTSGSVSVDAVWQQVLMSVAFATIPAAIGVAVLKYRLYDIDLVINRTVVLGVLAVFITGVYSAVVVGLGEVVGDGSSGLALPIAATAVIAVAFEPVRQLAQRWANRVVFGRRATPYEVLSTLTERLAVAESEEGVLGRMATLLHAGTGAERAAVWLGGEEALVLGASVPEAGVAPAMPISAIDGEVFAVRHEGAVVGALQVVKPKGVPLTPTERHLVADLAGSAGLVLGHHRLNESLAIRARELQQSRIRLVEAQDTERRRLERDLHDGAQQQIVALKVQLGLAARLAADHDDLQRLLDGLADEAQQALDEVRSLAKGIYPPLLASDGLRAAIASLASAAPVEVSVDGDGIGRYPADVEAAIYFNVSEAITNAVKHGRPPIRVSLSADGSALRYEVADAGPGFDPATVNGSSGFRNMVDRVDALGGSVRVDSMPGAATTVQGWVPLRGAVS